MLLVRLRAVYGMRLFLDLFTDAFLFELTLILELFLFIDDLVFDFCTLLPFISHSCTDFLDFSELRERPERFDFLDLALLPLLLLLTEPIDLREPVWVFPLGSTVFIEPRDK